MKNTLRLFEVNTLVFEGFIPRSFSDRILIDYPFFVTCTSPVLLGISKYDQIVIIIDGRSSREISTFTGQMSNFELCKPYSYSAYSYCTFFLNTSDLFPCCNCSFSFFKWIKKYCTNWVNWSFSELLPIRDFWTVEHFIIHNYLWNYPYSKRALLLRQSQ